MPPALPSDSVSLFVAGDVLLGRGVAPRLRDHTNLNIYREAIARADIAFCNLECVLSDRRALAGGTRLIASPSSASFLKSAGLDLVSLANNHSLDAGEGGLADMQRSLRQAGIATVGARTGDTPWREWRTTVRGQRIAWLAASAYGPYRAGRGEVRALAGSGLIEQARALAREGNAVFVSVHWGIEHDRTPSPGQRQTARALIDAGAGAVVGHHPHVAQPVEVYRGRPIFYSLGNFLFDRMPRDQDGMAAEITLDGRGEIRFCTLAVPFVVPGDAPSVAGGETVQAIHRACLLADASEQALVWSARPDRFATLRAYRRADRAWRTIAEARFPPLRDVLVGDVDGDGRDEALALYDGRAKLDVTMRPRLHVYGVDARKGFVPKWRGSGLARPFRDVRLFPAKSGCDLVAVETAPTAEFREFEWLAVYRWNGFGFAGIWETPVRGGISHLLTGSDERGAYIRFQRGTAATRRTLTLRRKADNAGFVATEEREPA